MGDLAKLLIRSRDDQIDRQVDPRRVGSSVRSEDVVFELGLLDTPGEHRHVRHAWSTVIWPNIWRASLERQTPLTLGEAMSKFPIVRAAPLMLMTALACRGGGDAVDPHAKNPTMALSMAEAAAAVSTTSTLLARSTFSDPHDQNFDIKRITDDWHIQIKSKPAFDIAVQTISFPPGSASGWHTHPGPVFIQVMSGTMTFYQSDDPTCSPQTRTQGRRLPRSRRAPAHRGESDERRRHDRRRLLRSPRTRRPVEVHGDRAA